MGLASGWSNTQALLRQRFNSSEQPYLTGAFALARKLGTFLRYHDQDWLVEWAKRLGLQGVFGKGHGGDQMSPETRSRLARFYAADVSRLEEFLTRDLDLWTPRSLTEPATLRENVG